MEKKVKPILATPGRFFQTKELFGKFVTYSDSSNFMPAQWLICRPCNSRVVSLNFSLAKFCPMIDGSHCLRIDFAITEDAEDCFNNAYVELLPV